MTTEQAVGLVVAVLLVVILVLVLLRLLDEDGADAAAGLVRFALMGRGWDRDG